MRLIRQNRYRRQPWKNGGGETIEIAVSPPEATTDDFNWRVSMARVETDGPFSVFPGIDRTLMVIDGDGIELDVEGYGLTTLTDAPHAFPGDRPTNARLLGGAITDLNVMTRRGVVAHRVSRLILTGPRDLVVRSPTVLVYCVSGGLLVEDDVASPVDVSAGDTLLVETRPMDLRFTPIGAGASAILVEIGPF